MKKDYREIRSEKGHIIRIYKKGIPLNEIISGVRDGEKKSDDDEQLDSTISKVMSSNYEFSKLVEINDKYEILENKPLQLVVKKFKEAKEANRCLRIFNNLQQEKCTLPPIVARAKEENAIVLSYFGEEGEDFVDPVSLRVGEKLPFTDKETYKKLGAEVRKYHQAGYVNEHEQWGICFFMKKGRTGIPIVVDVDNLKKCAKRGKEKKCAKEIIDIFYRIDVSMHDIFLNEYSKKNSEFEKIKRIIDRTLIIPF